MNTTKLDYSADITTRATVGDLIHAIQDAIDGYGYGIVLLDTDGNFHAAISDVDALDSYWTEHGPVAEVIHVTLELEATLEPTTAEELAAMAIELGWVDDAIAELADLTEDD